MLFASLSLALVAGGIITVTAVNGLQLVLYRPIGWQEQKRLPPPGIYLFMSWQITPSNFV